MACYIGTTTERGYGAAHKAERARWAPKVKTGTVPCARCGQTIQPWQPWDLGHTDDRRGWQGPEHRRCSRSAGGRNGARVTNAIKRNRRAVIRSRRW